MCVVERPECLLAEVNSVQRWLSEKHFAAGDELRQMTIQKRQQERRDVVPVGIGIRKNDDFAVPQLCRVEALAHSASERGDQIGQLFILEHACQREAFGVHYLPTKRQDRLTTAVAPLLGGSSRRVAF